MGVPILDFVESDNICGLNPLRLLPFSSPPPPPPPLFHNRIPSPHHHNKPPLRNRFYRPTPKLRSDFAGETALFKHFWVFFLFLIDQSVRRPHTMEPTLPPPHVLGAKKKNHTRYPTHVLLAKISEIWTLPDVCSIWCFRFFSYFAYPTENFEISVTQFGVRGSPLNFHNLGVGFCGDGLWISASSQSTEAAIAKSNP